MNTHPPRNDEPDICGDESQTDTRGTLNLADPAGANSPARWKVDAARIAETLEI